MSNSPFVRNQVRDLEGAVVELAQTAADRFDQLDAAQETSISLHVSVANEVLRRTTLLAALGRASVALNLAVRNATQQLILEELAQLRSEEPVGFLGRLRYLFTGAKPTSAHKPSEARWDTVQSLAVAAINADKACDDFAAGLAGVSPELLKLKFTPTSDLVAVTLDKAARAMASGASLESCPECNGRGLIDVDDSGHHKCVRACARCLGTGAVTAAVPSISPTSPSATTGPDASHVPEPAAAVGAVR